MKKYFNKTVCKTKFIVNVTRNDSQKRHILALCSSSVQKKSEKSVVRASAVDASDDYTFQKRDENPKRSQRYRWI